MLTGPSCATTAGPARYEGTVTIEGQEARPDLPAAEPSATASRYAINPPICGDDLPLPAYPSDLLGPEAPDVRVRVDFLINRDGLPEEITASLQDDDESADPNAPRFLDPAKAAIAQWRCAAAWRRPTPAEDVAWVPLPYRASIIFHFDAERVDGVALIDKKR